jgi:peroxiredoxin
MSELQGLQLNLDELRRRGVQVAGVVTDPPDTNARVVRSLGLGYRVLADADLRLIDAYGLRHPGAGPDGSDIAHAASLLLDRDGAVRWTAVTDNVRRRPTPATVLEAVDALREPRE